MAIPKTVHYCWLSNDPIPELYQKYVKSWRAKLPGYQFILWNTENFDLNMTTWTRQAFDTKMYACAADYIRLYAIYNYGGLYLDMDMEVIKPFDELLDNEIILGYETPNCDSVEAGCFGAVKNHPYIRKCMEYFENTLFFDPNEREKIMNMPVSSRYVYIAPLILPELMDMILKRDFQNCGYKVYPRDYFTVKDIITGAIKKRKVTFTVHHFATQYHSEEWRKTRAREQTIHRIFGERGGIIISKIRAVIIRMRQYGIGTALKYYFDKYIKNGKK